jgi:hypothetical protein
VINPIKTRRINNDWNRAKPEKKSSAGLRSEPQECEGIAMKAGFATLRPKDLCWFLGMV